MRDDYTHIVIIRDRSGSMKKIATDMDGGLQTFIDEQKKLDGYATCSLYDFDNQIEKRWDFVSIAEISDIPELVPRSMTALLDAEGIAIIETGERLASMNEGDRPSKVIVVVITDGLENASREYDNKMIKEMIKKQRETYGWQFTFIGANQDAVAEGSKLGVKRGSSADYKPTTQGVSDMYGSLSGGVARMRSMSASDYCVCVDNGDFYKTDKSDKKEKDEDANSNNL